MHHLIEVAVDALVPVHDEGRVDISVVDHYVHQRIESHARPSVL